MIQANELRIGNWVRVVGIYKDSINKAGIVLCDPELIKLADDNKILVIEIPLTPDILEKAGFKHGVSEGISRFGDTYEEVEEGNTHFWDIQIKETEFTDRHNISLVKWGEQEYFTFQLERGFYRQRIKHLHQLQNLYFALTGEELNIQL